MISEAALAGEDWFPLRGLLPHLSDDEASYVVHAVGLAEWHWATRHCPRCGDRLRPSQSGHVLHCDGCEFPTFWTAAPAQTPLITAWAV